MGKEVVTKFEAELKIKLTEGTEGKVLSINTKKALAGLNSQVSGMESRIIDLELAVDSAKDVLNDKIMPAELIEDSKVYVKGIVDAQAHLDRVEADLKVGQTTLEYFKKLRKEYFGI